MSKEKSEDNLCFNAGVQAQVDEWLGHTIKEIEGLNEEEESEIKQIAYLVTAFGVQLMAQLIELKAIHLGICPGCGEHFDLDDEIDNDGLFDWDSVFGSGNN